MAFGPVACKNWGQEKTLALNHQKITSRCALGLPRSPAKCSPQRITACPLTLWNRVLRLGSTGHRLPQTYVKTLPWASSSKKLLTQPYTDTHQINSASLLIALCPMQHLPACIDLPALATNQGGSRQIGRAEGSLPVRGNLGLRSTAQSTHTCTHTHSWFLQPFPFPSRNFQKSNSWDHSGLALLIVKGSKADWRRVLPKDFLSNFMNNHLGVPLTPNPKGTKQESSSWIPLYTSARAPTHHPHPHIYTHTYIHHEILWKFFRGGFSPSNMGQKENGDRVFLTLNLNHLLPSACI